MKKKLIIKTLTVCIPILLCVFTGCGATKGDEMLPLPYNAIIGLGGPLKFKEDFLKANGQLYGSSYLNENGEWDVMPPEFRTFIITEKAQLDEIFSVCPDIDFDNEMVVIYAFTGIYGRERKITSIILDNKNLKIEFKYVEGKPGYKDASMPQTRFLVIKMDKLDIDAVKFTLLNPRG